MDYAGFELKISVEKLINYKNALEANIKLLDERKKFFDAEHQEGQKNLIEKILCGKFAI